MPRFISLKLSYRRTLFVIAGLSISVLTIAQVNLKYRLLRGYKLSDEASTTKGKPTLFVFEQSSTFSEVFQPASGQKHDVPNFEKEMAIGITLPPTKTPPKLSVSKVFVQDSTLTVRYIRLADTTLAESPLTEATKPILLLSIPKQTVLKTKLVENGKVVQTLRKREE